ncbi:MAG: peptide-methionine (S)-S-oxide reductase MsrA [Candidatus Eisenbacteria bacterium]|uniref:Peptide methionine sulfoxide reductase MsrA n=1 Tax=Eiseniibacteriota bacterium TaxID=2212470 RepID=A0A956LY37_UNCEI|nr:peptide-methionine (S)-S-oxide reductase MsrA [Candidatus Eisenbacteria bacterium]
MIQPVIRKRRSTIETGSARKAFTTASRIPHFFRRTAARPATGLLVLSSVFLVALGCSTSDSDAKDPGSGGHGDKDTSLYRLTAADTTGLARAVFAGGCFWCEETAFEGVPGVHAAISGFAGGPEKNPTYEEVSSGKTGHTESVLVTYDPREISYQRLLEIFWVNHDPLTADRQFCDRGHQYRPAIFPQTAEQDSLAHASVAWAEAHLQVPGKIMTEITPGASFWPAENYHQDFWKKDPARYTSYRRGCGRDARLHELWGDLATGHP